MELLFWQWKHFVKEIILLYVRWYLKYPLSYRNLVEMMHEHGVDVTQTTIMRWVHQYSPILEQRLRKHIKLMNDSWRMDETYIKIKGKNAYLHLAVDSKGKTVDFYASERRSKTATKRFFRKALKAKPIKAQELLLQIGIVEQKWRYLKRHITKNWAAEHNTECANT